jgi:hypothetical protein
MMRMVAFGRGRRCTIGRCPTRGRERARVAGAAAGIGFAATIMVFTALLRRRMARTGAWRRRPCLGERHGSEKQRQYGDGNGTAGGVLRKKGILARLSPSFQMVLLSSDRSSQPMPSQSPSQLSALSSRFRAFYDSPLCLHASVVSRSEMGPLDL